MQYDIESNILSIELTAGKISHAREFGNFIIHFSKNEKPILIEILEADKFNKQFSKIPNLKNIKKIQEAIGLNYDM